MAKSKSQFQNLARRIGLFLLDCGLIVLSYYFAILLRFDGADAVRRPVVIQAMAPMLPYALLIYGIVFWVGGLYKIIWDYAGIRDIARMVFLSGLATAFILLVDTIVRQRPISGTVLIIGAMLNVLLMAGVRFLWRLLRTVNWARLQMDSPPKYDEYAANLLIVGAGNAAAWAVNLCKDKNRTFGNPVCLVDDDLTKNGLRIQGVPIRGTISDIPDLVRKYNIREIVIAIPSLDGNRLREVINLCNSTRCRVRILNDPQAIQSELNPNAEQPEELGVKSHGRSSFRDLDMSDFLTREELHLNNQQISQYIRDDVILVVGGAGSVGSELCRQIMRYRPRQLLILDSCESSAYELQRELEGIYGSYAPVVALVGSTREKERLDEVMELYHPNVVFHAASYKQVPLMELCPAEAVKTNILGTKNLLASCAEHEVATFILLSTDKAVNPTNVMGCTKRVCELLTQVYAADTRMKCVAVRFATVLGSSGSVLPMFETQIRNGGPVTITHPEAERSFLTITDAAQLILQTGALAETGGIYAIDMGEKVRILDIANSLIRFNGYEPGVNMDIEITGLRPGEKLHEDLLSEAEEGKTLPTDHDKIFKVPNAEMDLSRFYDEVTELLAHVGRNDETVVQNLQTIVHEYHPNRFVNKDHSVSAANGSTAIFSKEDIKKVLEENENKE